jgi:hypothetical protein
VLAGLAQCHDLGQEADYSALIPLMTIYLDAYPLKSSEKFSLMHIKFRRRGIVLYHIENNGFLFFAASLSRYAS